MSALWLAPLGARLVIPNGPAGPPAVLELTGRPVTGFNRRFGKPAYLLGAPLGTLGFTTLGAWNPEGPEPLPLRPDHPPSTVLATALDPHLLSVFHFPAVPRHLVNRPLATAPGPITLGDWMRGHGTGRLHRAPGPGARLELELTGLVPHGRYSVWGLLNTFRSANPVPLGGLPNTFLASSEGAARFTRELPFDPLTPPPGEAPLALIDVVFHAEPARVEGLPNPVTTAHVEFAVEGLPV